jgi:PIN domain nuclease of toxin-antitoxin system
MKLLLDTHIWIWGEIRPDKISRAVKRELERASNEIYLSPVSIWEAGQTERRGRWHARDGFSRWLERALTRTPVREAPLNFAVATEAASIYLPHGDPADTLIAATARVFDLTLVTADAQLLACSWIKTLAKE